MKFDEDLLVMLLDVGRAVWRVVHDRDENEERAKAIARAAIDAAVEEARHQAELVGIVIAHDVLDAATQRVLDAFVVKGDIKPLGLDITEVGPDEKFDPETP